MMCPGLRWIDRSPQPSLRALPPRQTHRDSISCAAFSGAFPRPLFPIQPRQTVSPTALRFSTITVTTPTPRHTVATAALAIGSFR